MLLKVIFNLHINVIEDVIYIIYYFYIIFKKI